MSEESHPSVLDFHSPRRPPIEAWRQLSAWQKGVCTHIQEGWAPLLALPETLQPGKIEPLQFDASLRRLPEEGIAVCFALGEEHLPSMMVFSARQIHTLLADLLSLPGETWPEERKLTTVEESMLELLFQKLGEAISEAWPASKPIPCRYLETEAKPQRTRLFPMGSPLLTLKLTIRSRFGEDTCYWLMLKEETEHLLLDHFGEAEIEERTPHPDLATLTERVPLELVVQLGETELTMSQATELAIGDVLILDQFVSRPLVATLAGQPKWGGFPVRIGSRQGFEVTRVINGNGPGAPSLSGSG